MTLNSVQDDGKNRKAVKIGKDLNSPKDDPESLNSSVNKPLFENKDKLERAKSDGTPSKIVSARNNTKPQLIIGDLQ